MADLVSGERAWAQGRRAKALYLFEVVACRAEEIDYVHHAALARERCAAILAESGRDEESRAQLVRARALYERWGAHAKVRALDSAPAPSA